MIVRPADGVLQAITQPDHAALAGRIMSHWTALADHPRRAPILLAVAEHDNGWQEPDAAPLIDPASGRVADFMTAPIAVRQGVWPRAVARLASDPWAAGLVAQHAAFVYSRFRGDPAWAGFFAEMEASRDAHVRAGSRRLDELFEDYAFVRLGDLISLTFCAGWTDEQDHAGYRVRRDGAHLTVTPDPFDRRTIAFDIQARELPDRRFDSDEDLRRTLAAAPVVTLNGTVSSLPAPPGTPGSRN
jgi:hypothetical protein